MSEEQLDPSVAIALIASGIRASRLIGVDEIAWLSVYTSRLPEPPWPDPDELWQRMLSEAKRQRIEDAAQFSAGKVINVAKVIPDGHVGERWELVAEVDLSVMYRFDHRTFARRLALLDAAGRALVLRAVCVRQVTMTEADRSEWQQREYSALLDRVRQRLAKTIRHREGG